MEVQGTMMMEIQNEDDAFVKVAIDTEALNEGYQFKTHPNIDKQLHANEGILGLKDPNRPFPCGSPLGILKWRFQTKDESKVPIVINCWPSVSSGRILRLYRIRSLGRHGVRKRLHRHPVAFLPGTTNR